jgi:hypothetical protein
VRAACARTSRQISAAVAAAMRLPGESNEFKLNKLDKLDDLDKLDKLHR